MEEKEKSNLKGIFLKNEDIKDEESRVINSNDDNSLDSSNIQIIDDIIYKKDKKEEINQYKKVLMMKNIKKCLLY